MIKYAAEYKVGKKLIKEARKLNKSNMSASPSRKSMIKNWLMQQPRAFEIIIENAYWITEFRISPYE